MLVDGLDVVEVEVCIEECCVVKVVCDFVCVDGICVELFVVGIVLEDKLGGVIEWRCV